MHVTLHLTTRCNMRCHYCYAAPHTSDDMTLETAKRAIQLGMQELKRKGKPQNLGVIFFGGEPLLQRELITAIVRDCRRVTAETGQQFHFKMTTNGLLLDETFLTDPETADIYIAMSMDGTPTAHDTHRVDAGGAGTFARLSPSIDLLLRHKPYSPAMMVISPETVGQYADSVAYAYTRGFRYLICSLNYAGDWHPVQLAELTRQYRKLATWYERLMLAEEKFYFSPFEVKISSHIFPGKCHADRCELGQRQISVAPDGRLYPCVQFVGDAAYCIGDVASGLDETRRQGLFTQNGAEKPECTDCAIRERCNHHCGCLNRQTTGSIDRVSPVLCAHERSVLPIADRLAARLFKRRSPMFIQKHYNELYPLISLVEDRSHHH